MIRDLFDPEKEPTEEAPLVCRLTTELLRPADQSWRLLSIMSEFIAGFNILRHIGPAATFWGSARLQPGDKYYDQAETLAARLSERGLAIVTGGAGGIMEAGNVGAFKAGGSSIGLNIRLPKEQRANPYVTESHTFDHFFARKVMLTYASEVYVYFPGGFGTLDELFEIITLIQTKKITAVPVILYGREFWEPLVAWMQTSLLETFATIDTEDLQIFTIVDSVDEAEKLILKRLSASCDFRPAKKKLRRGIIPKV